MFSGGCVINWMNLYWTKMTVGTEKGIVTVVVKGEPGAKELGALKSVGLV